MFLADALIHDANAALQDRKITLRRIAVNAVASIFALRMGHEMMLCHMSFRAFVEAAFIGVQM